MEALHEIGQGSTFQSGFDQGWNSKDGVRPMQKPHLGVWPGVFSTLWSLVNVFGLQLGFFQIKTIIKPYSFIISDLVSSNLHTLGIQKFEKLKELK